MIETKTTYVINDQARSILILQDGQIIHQETSCRRRADNLTRIAVLLNRWGVTASELPLYQARELRRYGLQ